MAPPGTDADAAGLRSALESELGIEVADVEVVSEKLNRIVAITTPDAGTAYVLHQPLKLRDTGLFNDPRREYEVVRRLRETSIPTQDPVAFCDDESILGGPFFVTTYLEGEPVPVGADLPARFRTPGARERLADRLVETLAEVHAIDRGPFATVCDRQSARDQISIAFDRLDAASSATGREFPRLRSVGERLRRGAPEGGTPALVHGDFRPGNVLIAGTDRPEITGVLDWETAMLGDPLTELGYLLLRWRDEGDPTPSLDDIEARYPDSDAIRQLRDATERGLSPFSSKPGSPSRRELVARYEGLTGTAFEDERFYRAHAAFMLGTVWADLHRHAIEAGTESATEPYVEYMALLADGIVSGEFPL